MKKFFAGAIAVLFLFAFVFFGLTATGRTIWNGWMYSIQKTNEKTYESQKQVEDTCRAMIASYNQDKAVYEMYKDSSVEEERSWANNAKIRANNTAATYNTYILKNSFIWASNVPPDIKAELPMLK